MTKVYPNAAAEEVAEGEYGLIRKESVLTVWKKSLLFNCSGFTVFDSEGNLIFRVDNYASDHKGELVLMDASGKSLLTMRRKMRMSFSDLWQVFDGDDDCGSGSAATPRFQVKKQSHLRNSKSKVLAHVFSSSSSKAWCFEIEGCYGKRLCTVYDEKRRKVAEIKRKETAGGVALGDDVFRLIVQPEIDHAVAMALVLLLDQMFSSRWSSSKN